MRKISSYPCELEAFIFLRKMNIMHEYKTFDQQIDILKNRGLIINLNTKADGTC